MRKLSGIGFTALIVLAVSCKNTTTKTATDSVKTTATETDSVKATLPATNVAKWGNVEVQAPRGWSAQPKFMNGRNLLFLLGPTELNYQTNMNILKDPMKGESLDDYMKVSLAKMKNMQITMGPSGSMQVGGLDGRYLKYLYNAPERQIAAKSYVFAKNDTAYVVSATTLPELGKKYEPVFDEAVNSIKIK